jgi:hypothetical protein
MDLIQRELFSSGGYRLGHIVITDDSLADINADGSLEPHSTAVIEIVKALDYSRSAHSQLDECIEKYGAGNVSEQYLLRLTAFVHLDHLAAQRVTPNSSMTSAETWEKGLAHFEDLWAEHATNHAFDVNVLKWLLADNLPLPADSTEYVASFQLTPESIDGTFAQLIADSSAASDNVCVDIFEGHIDAYSAIIPASSGVRNNTNVFYQVPVSEVPTRTLPGTQLGEGYRRYCTLDDAGRLVGIYDPATQTTHLACDRRKPIQAQLKMTKPGACQSSKSHWAYYPARARSARFGRGIQWILTEWLIHDQVGDYKNIHWYDSAWKAGVQTAVKAGMFIARTAIGIAAGSINVPNAPGGTTVVYIINTVMPYWANVLEQIDGLKIAGYTLTGTASVNSFLLQLGTANASNATFTSTLGNAMGAFFMNFLIQRTTDAVGQMLDVTAVGWQDFSDDSHYGCFEFSY